MPDRILLPGGPVVLHEPAGDSPAFAAGLWFPRGSRHEAPHERGFSHFLEHMLFKGTPTRDAQELSRLIERTGGYINAFTERDCVCLHCTVPAGEWKTALDVLADMAFASTLPEEEFDREKNVILSEIAAAEEDSEECSHDALLFRLWPGHPAALKIGGTEAEVALVGHGPLNVFYRERFSPDGTVLALSGGPEAREAADYFGEAVNRHRREAGMDSPGKGQPKDSAPRPAIFSGYTRADGNQAYYYEALQMDGPFAVSDFHALAALNGIIGESSSSRLFQRLREREGLCYSVYSTFAMTRNECLWYAQAATADANLARCARAMDEEIGRIARGEIGGQECADSVSRLSGAFSLALEDPDFRMRRLAREYLADGEVVDARVERERYASVRREDILDMARRLLGSGLRARYAYGRVSRRSAKAVGLEEC